MVTPAEPEKSKARSRSGAGADQRLGKYRITGKLGRGGMGVVYAAEDTLLRRPVAIKVLSSALAKDPQALERFLREARAVARLNHPNVVSIYEIDQKDGLWYLGMELVGAGSLQGVLKDHGAVEWRTGTEANCLTLRQATECGATTLPQPRSRRVSRSSRKGRSRE
jgi:serine/threonine protein kinase